MRVCSRVALVVILVVGAVAPAFPQRLTGDCPLQLVQTSAPPIGSSFELSSHGVFRSGSQLFELRGQTLTTYTLTDVGDLQRVRDDVIGTLGARENEGAVVFANGLMYVSGEAGLEIYNLANVRAGGTAPQLVSRTPGLRYHRLAISGTTLAGLYPATDLPCAPNAAPSCFNTIDLFSVANPSAPARVGTVTSLGSLILGFNDLAVVNGFLVATGTGGTYVFNIGNPRVPTGVTFDGTPGEFIITNGTNLIAVGTGQSIETFSIGTGGSLTPLAIHNINTLRIERSNPIAFHPQGAIDESGTRLITMVDEIDPQTLRPARTIAFDVFDYTVPFNIGSDPKPNETVSYTQIDEVKYNPVVVGPYIHVLGSLSGLQTYGACGQVAGAIELDSLLSLNCGGSEIHGWVTGAQRIANVELFIDQTPLTSPPVTLSGPPRTDISSRTPVFTWRVAVNLDQTTRGEHVLHAIATDTSGNRRQFATRTIFFGGPGQNCSNRRRTAAVH